MSTFDPARRVTRRQFEKSLAAQLRSVADLVLQRNASYAGEDALKCWRKRGLAGMLVRLEDKMNRFETFLERGGATAEEWQELFADICGYALCARIWTACGDDPSVRDDAA